MAYMALEQIVQHKSEISMRHDELSMKEKGDL